MHSSLIVPLLLAAMLVAEARRAAIEFWDYHQKARPAARRRQKRVSLAPRRLQRVVKNHIKRPTLLRGAQHWGAAFGVGVLALMPALYHLAATLSS